MTCTHTLYMSQYEESRPVDEHHAFFVKAAGTETTLYVEFYCGDQAALELGRYENAGPGLNGMGPDENCFSLLVADPAMSQADALKRVMESLVAHGLPEAPFQEGSLEDFADHPEAQMVMAFAEMVQEIKAGTMETMEIGDLQRDLGITDEELEAHRKESAEEEVEALARGRERFAKEAPK